MEIKQTILEYLREAKMMQLATTKDDQPWVCNVWFAADDDGHIFWLSNTTRRHSTELLENAQVAGAMCLPQIPGEPGRGVQFSGKAVQLTEQDDIDAALEVYADRIFPRDKIVDMLANTEKPQAFYRIDVDTYKLYDAVNFSDKPVQFWEPLNR